MQLDTSKLFGAFRKLNTPASRLTLASALCLGVCAVSAFAQGGDDVFVNFGRGATNSAVLFGRTFGVIGFIICGILGLVGVIHNMFAKIGSLLFFALFIIFPGSILSWIERLGGGTA